MKSSPFLNNFTGGEFTPRLAARTDFEKYPSGCKLLQNFIVLQQGGIWRRPGTRFVAEVSDSDQFTRIVPFTYSDEDAYIIEVGEEYMRFYKNFGVIMDGESPYEIVTPYQEADLRALNFRAKSADIVYIFHKSYPPMKLTRSGDAAWSITEVAWNDGPYLDMDTDPAIFITPDTTGNPITLTATDEDDDPVDLWTADHIGSLWYLQREGWVGGMTCTSGNQQSGAFKLYGRYSVDLEPVVTDAVMWNGRIVLQKTYDDTYWFDIASFHNSTHQEFFETDSKANFRFNCKTGDYGEGVCTIKACNEPKWTPLLIDDFTTSDEVITSLQNVTLVNTDPTPFWREGAWSGYQGYPRCGCFFRGRLWASSTTRSPQGIWGSWIEDFERFQPGDTDEATIEWALRSQDAIQWILGHKHLVVGTIGGVWSLVGIDESKPLGPKNPPNDRFETSVGCAAGLEPIIIEPAILHVDSTRKRIRELAYSFEYDTMKSADLSLLARHLNRSGITDMAFQRVPFGVLWVTNASGTLTGMTYHREENVVAWHKHPMANGEVESVATIPSAMGTTAGHDILWMVVKRTIGGSTKRFIEYMTHCDEDTAQEDMIFVDCSLTYDSGTATDVVSGLDHLIGQTVSILGDGVVFPDQVVDAEGEVTLPVECNVIHVGLSYNSVCIPNVPETGTEDGGTSRGRVRNLNEVTLVMLSSMGGKIGPTTDKLDWIQYRYPRHNMDENPPLFTGEITMPIRGNDDGIPTLAITQAQPLPLGVLGVGLRVGTGA